MKNPQHLLKSFLPVIKNNWIIKFSIMDGNVLLTVFSMSTGQTFIRYYEDEDLAVKFINFILEQNADDMLPYTI